MESRLIGKRIAVYARYSSERQRDTSIDDQVRRCREYVEGLGGTVEADRIFTDYAASGASLARTGFEAMMALVTKKPAGVDCIVTEDVSRVTRDLADGAALFKKLQYLGIALLGVADGIDTSAKNAKVSFTVKNLVADLYLDDLRDKTMRGLEGRQRAGFSTGNPPYGYRTVAVKSPEGRDVGFRIEIDEDKAPVVRRVFQLYLDGRSLSGIAKLLCSEDIPPPRANTRHRRMGWCDSTVRVFLHNRKYAGVWRYKEREWLRVPGEDRRLPRFRPASEVMELVRPDLRILDEDVWKEVQSRLAAVRRHYTRTADGRPKGRALSGKSTGYLLSGLLYCGCCGAPMIVYGGSSSKYYRCPDSVKRGTCANDLGVKEKVARACLLDALRDRLLTPIGIAHARKRLAERLDELARKVGGELEERRKRLGRTEGRIAGLIQFIADGDRSEYVRTTLRDLEAQATSEKASIAEIQAQTAAPMRLPTLADMEELVFDLSARLADEPVKAREQLRKLFKDGRVVLEPLPDRVYVARTELLPMVLMAGYEKRNRRFRGSEPAVSSSGSGGEI